jgi:hypothetical protein
MLFDAWMTERQKQLGYMCLPLVQRRGECAMICFYSIYILIPDLAPPPLECSQTKKAFEYGGYLDITASGKQCKRWITHEGRRFERRIPDQNLMEANNYCRNVRRQGRARPWCLVSEGTTGWEYCDLPSCSFEGMIELYDCTRLA